MTPPANPALVEEAVALAREAGRTTLRWFRRDDLVVERKGDGTPVTAADRAAERVVRDAVAARHPGDAVLGEEEGLSPGTSGRRWVVDPIDGTKAFCHGVPLYSTLLAVDDEDGPLIGVIDLPALGETVWAGRGVGCWCDGRPAHVSLHSDLPGSYLTTSGFDYWPEAALLAVRHSGMQMRTWGDGYGYALVATGRVDAMVDPLAGDWDLAPMPVIMSEAGGRFSDWAGRPVTDSGSGLATNGRLHEAVLALLSPG